MGLNSLKFYYYIFSIFSSKYPFFGGSDILVFVINNRVIYFIDEWSASGLFELRILGFVWRLQCSSLKQDCGDRDQVYGDCVGEFFDVDHVGG